MKIPQKLNIKGRIWDVVFNPDLEDIDNAVGLCVYGVRKIFLSSNQGKRELPDTFLHEILHSIFPHKLCSHKKEEKIIEKLAGRLLQVLRDNKLKF